MKHKLQSIGIAIGSLLVMSWVVQGCQLYLEAQNSEVSKFWGGTVTLAILLGLFGIGKALETWK